MDYDRRAKAEEMRSLRVAVMNAAICLCVALALEFVAYPWSIMQGMFTYPWHVTLISYLLVALIVTAFCSVMPSLLIYHAGSYLRLESSRSLCLAAMYAAIGACGLLINLFLFSGPGLFINVPGTRVVSFFSEFQFLTFAFHVGLPVCLVAAGIYAWGVSRRR